MLDFFWDVVFWLGLEVLGDGSSVFQAIAPPTKIAAANKKNAFDLNLGKVI